LRRNKLLTLKQNKMKTKTLIAALIMSITSVFAQTKNSKMEQKIEIKTSAVCGMCKATISKAMKKEAGVIASALDIKTSVLTVNYDPTKTTPEKIRKAVTMAGYDADDMPADPSAYSKLDACCKKDNQVEKK
jgi:mercuric ion binding protein